MKTLAVMCHGMQEERTLFDSAVFEDLFDLRRDVLNAIRAVS